MNDLVTWLRVRLDEDEALAREAEEVAPNASQTDPNSSNFNPARALVEVEAKRRILDEHDPDWPRLECPTCCGYDGNDNYGVERRPREAYPCRVVRWLALPYADHSTYREEWRP
jgi:hypothetical protein